jgi:hypothetical protein
MNKRVEHKVAWKQAKRERPNDSISPTPQKLASEASSPQSSSLRTTHFRPKENSVGSPDSGKSPVEQGLIRSQAPTPQLCVPMSTDWRNSALCRFFSDYVIEANEVKVSPGYLNHLPKLYSEGNDEIITHAVSAVSLASFSNQVRSEELLIQGRKLYGKALLLVKRALSNPKQVTKDGTLAGVFFLNMYEV